MKTARRRRESALALFSALDEQQSGAIEQHAVERFVKSVDPKVWDAREFECSFGDPLGDGFVDLLTWQAWLVPAMGALSDQAFIRVMEEGKRPGLLRQQGGSPSFESWTSVVMA